MRRLFYSVSEFMKLINKPITPSIITSASSSGPAVVQKDNSFGSVVGLLVSLSSFDL